MQIIHFSFYEENMKYKNPSFMVIYNITIYYNNKLLPILSSSFVFFSLSLFFSISSYIYWFFSSSFSLLCVCMCVFFICRYLFSLFLLLLLAAAFSFDFYIICDLAIYIWNSTWIWQIKLKTISKERLSLFIISPPSNKSLILFFYYHF